MMQLKRNCPTELIVYFNGVTEGQYALINEEYSEKILDAWTILNAKSKPLLTIIASSKTHNERFYKVDGKGIVNLEPGTVVDHTVVSPVLSEFYLASAAARQGTTKTTKFTIIYSEHPKNSMERMETLTNDLCYQHQIVLQPVGLPVPLFVAGLYSQRGGLVLSFFGPVMNNGQVDFQATNQTLGYGNKQLFLTRFNA